MPHLRRKQTAGVRVALHARGRDRCGGLCPPQSRGPFPTQRLTHERAPAEPNSRTGPRNLSVSAAAHDSLRLPRKTMLSEATGRTIPDACHAKRTLRARFPTPATQIHLRDTSGGHLSPHLPRGTTPRCLSERRPASEVPRLPRDTHIHHARTQHAPTPIPMARN